MGKCIGMNIDCGYIVNKVCTATISCPYAGMVNKQQAAMENMTANQAREILRDVAEYITYDPEYGILFDSRYVRAVEIACVSLNSSMSTTPSIESLKKIRDILHEHFGFYTSQAVWDKQGNLVSKYLHTGQYHEDGGEIIAMVDDLIKKSKESCSECENISRIDYQVCRRRTGNEPMRTMQLANYCPNCGRRIRGF